MWFIHGNTPVSAALWRVNDIIKITPSPPLQTIGTINHNFFAAGILLVYTANGLIAGCQCDRCPMNNLVLQYILHWIGQWNIVYGAKCSSNLARRLEVRVKMTRGLLGRIWGSLLNFNSNDRIFKRKQKQYYFHMDRK